MNLSAEVGIALSGRWRVVKENSDGIVMDESFDNIVLDVGWENFKEYAVATFYASAYRPVPKYLYLGTGSTEPAATDLGLESVSATLPGKYRTALSFSGDTSYPNGIGYHQANLTFAYGEGEAEGVWTELGLAYDDAYSKPYNRSLFRDENGSAISITVLNDEWLTIYVSLKAYLIQNTATSLINYNGVDHTVTWSMSNTFAGYLGRGFWTFGLPNRVSYGVFGSSDLAHDGNLTTSTSEELISNPGSERTCSGGNFSVPRYSNRDDYRQAQVSFSISPAVIIPPDHKAVLSGTTSLAWTRQPVPTV